MRINEIEIHELEHESTGVATRPDGEIMYEPDGAVTGRSFVLTIRTADGLEGHHAGGHPGAVTDHVR